MVQMTMVLILKFVSSVDISTIYRTIFGRNLVEYYSRRQGYSCSVTDTVGRLSPAVSVSVDSYPWLVATHYTKQSFQQPALTLGKQAMLTWTERVAINSTIQCHIIPQIQYIIDGVGPEHCYVTSLGLAAAS